MDIDDNMMMTIMMMMVMIVLHNYLPTYLPIIILIGNNHK